MEHLFLFTGVMVNPISNKGFPHLSRDTAMCCHQEGDVRLPPPFLLVQNLSVRETPRSDTTKLQAVFLSGDFRGEVSPEAELCQVKYVTLTTDLWTSNQ